MSDVSELLISLTKKELPWAIHSGCLEEMSDVSEFLISLTKNEQMSESLIFWANHSFFLHKKRAIRSEIKWANSQPWIVEVQIQIFSTQHLRQSFNFQKIPGGLNINIFLWKSAWSFVLH